MSRIFTTTKILWCLVLTFLIASCAKDNDPSGALNGTYVGYYIQTGDLKDTGVVQLVFVGSIFSGSSTGTTKSICNGNYDVSGDSINFTNLCTTPDADLLLVGKYKMTTAGDSLYFTRTISGTENYEDHFNLRKQ
jgi:hypothetical protein